MADKGMTICLWFDNQAEEAANSRKSVWPAEQKSELFVFTLNN